MTGLYIQLSDCGQHIRKWSHQRFDDANAYAYRTQPDGLLPADEVEVAARAAARALGFDFDEVCGHETEEEACDSSTCIGGLNEDHHPEDCREMMRKIARAALATQPPAARPFFSDTALGSLNYRKSWPRSATPCDLAPLWAGEFATHGDWVNFATKRLTGTTGTYGTEAPAICVDARGRRCLGGADMARARDEGAFPVRYFFECVDPRGAAGMPRNDGPDQDDVA